MGNKRFAAPRNLLQAVSQWKSSRMVRIVMFGLIAVMFYFSVSGSLLTPTYDIELGQQTERAILAPREIANEAATEKARQEAVERVEDVYTQIPVRNLDLVNNIFRKLTQINGDTELNAQDKVEIYRMFFTEEYQELIRRPVAGNKEYAEVFMNEIQRQFVNQQYRIPEEIYFKLPQLDEEQLKVMVTVARDVVGKLGAERVSDALASRARVAELVLGSTLENKMSRELVQELIRFAITPNVFLDEQATEEAKQRAQDSIEPIIIAKNDVIVAEGQRITAEQYALLSELDLLTDKASYWPQLGLILMVVLFTSLLAVFVYKSEHSVNSNNVQLFMLVLILFLTLIFIKVVSLVQSPQHPYVGYLAPVAMGSIMITILLEARIAFISSVLFAMISSVVYNVEYPELLFDFRYGFIVVLVCLVSIFAIDKASHRASILKAGFLVSFFACLAHLSMVLLKDEYILTDMLLSFIFAFGSGLITAVLVIGLLPFFEIAFGILSPLKLVELSNPNNPLLRKILTETPGTYHHSVMVGNLAEAAAEAVGANGLLCRVGAYYHDVGKTRRPSYFIENQVNMENPHDHIDPTLSKSIITAHAKDGADMLREHKMPKQICDIAEQHHGTTFLKYFYHKAHKLHQENPDVSDPVHEDDFRYPGPKAQTKEAAIVGISDCVEAAVRSLRNPTIEHIDSMVDKIIKDRVDDDQFNECDITMKELDTVSKALKETLLGIFHSRIEYPDLPKAVSTGASTNGADKS